MVTKFQKGDYIVYSSNGVCLIEDIKNADFNPQSKEIMYDLYPQETQ